MLFDTERSAKAPDVKTYEELTQKIESHTRYARKLLGVCTQELQIPERRVLQATREWATTQYTEFTIDVAKRFDWVVSLIAMIPCVQVSTSTRTSIKSFKGRKWTVTVIL
jgi:thiaminase